VSPLAAAVRWASLIASAFVVLGFVFFLVNQTSTASKNQVVAITGGTDVKAESATKVPNPSPAVEKLREKENDKLHEFVDDVNDVLLAPFTGIINSDSIWVIRLFTLGCALLIYGLLGQYLARAMGLRRW
jgi:hypothetical protein